MTKIIKKTSRLGSLFILSGVLALIILLSTRTVLASAKEDNPYLIKVNRVHNTITVYTQDEKGKYNVPVKAMTCSVGKLGTQTRVGTFQTRAKYRWKALMGNVWGQYSTRIVGGILFHSVYYYENGNPETLANKEYNKLGSAASHGCIRLTVADAKWIYDNCIVGTTVVVYDDEKSPGPLGKPEAIKLPSKVRWDPTDPNTNNPYKTKKPVISGVKSMTLPWGVDVDLLEGVKAKSTVGTDITSSLSVEGSIDKYSAGSYKITYMVTDLLGRTGKKTTTVNIEENPIQTVFEGIYDRTIIKGTKVNRKFVLSGVSISYDGIRFDESQIDINIDRISDEEYEITYSIEIYEDVSIEKKIYYTIDDEAPLFFGVGDRLLLADQEPDQAYALEGIDIWDNYTIMHIRDITVTIEKITGANEDFNSTVDSGATEEIVTGGTDNISYLVTYEATDEAGNSAKVTGIFHY
ncbi:MAG TPA: L,D-transpeptidase family protein [Mobilitalea sp.]|nr:L,D-transpeptidase family protein [Mobilitalea sp.]